MSGKINQGMIEDGVSRILRGLGVDLTDHNYIDTPERVARMYVEMFTPKENEWATFEEDFSDFILLKGHTLYGLCPHHLLPVELVISLAYVPNGHVLGLSKLARICDEVNTGPMLQERFTVEVLTRLEELCPGIRGAACIVDGQHGCTKVRGVKSDGRFTTYRLSGCFKDDPELESRFFTLAGGGR